MEVLKEEKSKTKVDRALSRSRSGREDSKHSLLVEKDAQLGGQQQIYDQVREKNELSSLFLIYKKSIFISFCTLLA